MKPIRLAAALWLAAPAAAYGQQAEDPPICTDRPGKANATCTVPAGKWQLESSIVDWTGNESGGGRTVTWTIGSSYLKLGLTGHSDLQIGFTPYIRAKTKAGAGNLSVSGVGDVTVRYKHRFTDETSKVQFAAIPFVKLPTANHDIGNSKFEAGLATTASTALGNATLTIGPELDLLADNDGAGLHPQLVNVVSLSATVAPRLTLGGDLWTATNFDPAGTITQASADASLAYLANDNVQLDAGANFGLNRNTPDVELYAGLSIRF